MPVLIQYKIIDSFNEYNDYLIHQDDIDVTDEENLIIDLVGGDRDEGDYRDISVIETYKISVQEALFLKRMFIAFPFGGDGWLRQLAIKQYDEENCLTVKERSE
tara:strand:- start:1379 stop:1690 length:312 start_codon:yes stop_codon:yes gene_type:complete